MEVNASHSGGPGLYITLLPALLYDSSAGLQLADVCTFWRGEGGEQAEGGGPWRSLSPTCLSLNSVSLSAAGAGWEGKSSKEEIKTSHRSELGSDMCGTQKSPALLWLGFEMWMPAVI